MILDVNNIYIILWFKTSFSVHWLRLHDYNGHAWVGTFIINDRKKSSFQNVVFLKFQAGASVHTVMLPVAVSYVQFATLNSECGVRTPRCWPTLLMKHSFTRIFRNLWVKLVQKLFKLFIKVQWIVSFSFAL